IDNLDGGFDMREWHTCIAGHCCKLFHIRLKSRYYRQAAQTALELTDEEAKELFCPRLPTESVPRPAWLMLLCPPPPMAYNQIDNKVAARALRHFAVTGEVSFDVGREGRATQERELREVTA